MSNNITNSIIEDYLDDKVLALVLAVEFWGSAVRNDKTTPPGNGKIIETAQTFHRYLTS